MSAVDDMATAVSKPAYPPKVKRPPPPFSPSGSKGVKPQPGSSSPQPSSKRVPGPNSINGSASHLPNGVNPSATKGPLGRTRRDVQRPGDPSLRLQKPLTRAASADTGRRTNKIAPEPYGEFPFNVILDAAD